MRRGPWLFIFSLVIGVGIGLAFSWIVAPVDVTASAPGALRSDFRDGFRLLISSAYSATGDLARARARLALLGDDDPIRALSAQAQQMLASGQPFEQARQLASLASDLQTGVSSAPIPLSPTGTREDATSLPTQGATPDMTTTVAVLTASPAGPNIALPSALNVSPIAPGTPMPTPGGPFRLLSRQDICGPNVQPGLLRVSVLDRIGRPIPGVAISITWDQGEERFFTGFQPDLGEGYADYIMRAGTVYSLRVGSLGAPISNLAAPVCPASEDGGPTFTGGLEVTLQES